MQNRRQNLPEISIETVLSISDSPQNCPRKNKNATARMLKKIQEE
jgi:hypothetical protein